MSMMKTIVLLLFICLGTLQADPFQKAQTEVRTRSHAEVSYEQQMAAREKTAILVAKLLHKPLTVASAVQIALLNNRELQATFCEVGIAQADLIAAVTFPNPSINFEVEFPNSGTSFNRYMWFIAQDFAQMVMTPLKKKIAEEQLEAVQWHVATEALTLVAKVKEAYVTYQAEQQLLARLQIIQETNAAALELSQKQFKAGNTTDLALLQSQSNYSQGKMELLKVETDLRNQREKLNRLLGLWGGAVSWKIQGEIMPVATIDFSIQHLESLAVMQRLDLRAAHRELTSIVSALGLTKTYRWTPVLNIGFMGERDIQPALNMGPAFSLELPIFNQGQARIAHGEAQLRMAENKLEALAVNIRSEVRELRDRLISLASTAQYYQKDLLPLRISIVNKALLQYNAMQLSAYELFMIKAQEVEVERDYIATLRDYWITRAELERVVGGTLTPRQQHLGISQ